MSNHKLSREEVKALAFNAFKAHYETTKKPGWKPAETHWFENEGARKLWCVIIDAVLTAFAVNQNAAAEAKAKHLLNLPSKIPAGGPTAQAFLAGLDFGEVEKRELADHQSGDMTPDRVKAAIELATQYNTSELLYSAVEKDYYNGRRIYWVNPSYWPIVAKSGAVKTVTSDPIHGPESLLIWLHDGTKFRLSGVVPNGGFYYVVHKIGGGMDVKEYIPPSFATDAMLKQH